MEKTFTLTVNGRSRTVVTDPDRKLLDVLREDFDLTGTKYGCGEGQCHACTVLVDGKAAVSCLTRIEEVNGRSLLTIEGLASGEALHPVQQAFLDADAAFQCGYCTPGMIMGAVGLLNEKPRATEQELKSGLEKHLCRCCNYAGIASALGKVAAQAATK